MFTRKLDAAAPNFRGSSAASFAVRLAGDPSVRTARPYAPLVARSVPPQPFLPIPNRFHVPHHSRPALLPRGSPFPQTQVTHAVPYAIVLLFEVIIANLPQKVAFHV